MFFRCRDLIHNRFRPGRHFQPISQPIPHPFPPWGTVMMRWSSADRGISFAGVTATEEPAEITMIGVQSGREFFLLRRSWWRLICIVSHWRSSGRRSDGGGGWQRGGPYPRQNYTSARRTQFRGPTGSSWYRWLGNETTTWMVIRVCFAFFRV